jgi:hypothetical protein
MIEDFDQKDDTKPDHPDDGFSLSEIHPAISPIAAAFIGLIGGFFLYQIVGGTITLIIFGFKPENAPVMSLRLMTMGGQVFFILLPALLFTKWFYADITRVLRVRFPEIKELLFFTVGIIILTFLLQSYLIIQTYYFEMLARHFHVINSIKLFLDNLNDMVEKSYGDLLKAGSAGDAVLVILIAAFVPALCEETMFRGFIQRSFEFKLKPFRAALITAIFFGVYHFNPYGLIPLISLGFYFGFASYTSNSIFTPMFLHFFNNFIMLIAYFILGDKDLLDNPTAKNIDIYSTFILFFVLLLLFSVVIYLIKRYYSQKMRNDYAGMP